jgi:Collagen triple helix repeat (20 copies)
MLSPLRNRFGIPGVISVIALVFAMLGGAYAASNDSGGGKATASAKAKRGPRGPKGATGPAGPTGPTGPAGANGKDGASGPQGPAGPTGPAGPAGTAGAAGAAGKDGKSVLANEIPSGEATCDKQGGAEYEVEDSGEPTLICNGKEGSPWTAGGTLPPGAVETGTWSASGEFHQFVAEYKVGPLGEEEFEKKDITIGGGSMSAPISFPIPLASFIKFDHVFYGEGTNTEGTETEFTQHCPGPSAFRPEVATAGDLCVYVRSPSLGVKFLEISGGTKAGVLLEFSVPKNSVAGAQGTFALKGCNATEEPNQCP